MKPYYLVITPFFPTETTIRGPFIYDQVRAIKKTGRYRDVLVFKPASPFDRRTSYDYEGITVRLFPFLQMPSLILNGLTNGINSALFLKAFRRAGFSPDRIAVAHAHTSVFAACALSLKAASPQTVALVQHHDGDPYTIRNGKFASCAFNARYRAKKNIRLFNRMDCHVSISKFVERHLLEFPAVNPQDYFESYRNSLSLVQNLPSITPKKSLILYNGVDTGQFHPSPRQRKNEKLTIGCVGNFVDLKDQITLIKAVEQLLAREQGSGILLKFIGTGPTLEECRAYVREHRLESSITFQTEIPHAELAAFYHSLDLFVLPSFFEGFGCVLLEAHACGVPFMTCRGQGGAEYIPPEDGDKWLFAPRDHVGLAALISRFNKERYPQSVRHEYDINILITRFLDQIDPAGSERTENGNGGQTGP